MTASTLRSQSCKDLAQMARAMGLPGWHSMRKDELVRALVTHAKRNAKKLSNGHTAAVALREQNSAGRSAKVSREIEQLRQLRAQMAEDRQLSSPVRTEANRDIQDRLVVMVRDPYWLHAYWE